MDRWIQAVGLLCSRVGYEQQPKRVESSEIGTRLIPAGTADSSKTVTRKMILCLEDGIREVDIARIRQCRAIGIAMDKGGDHLVVYGRLVGPTGLYEMLLGVVTPDMVQDSSRGMLEALQLLLKQVCIIPARCRRPADDMFNSPSDRFDAGLYNHLCDHIFTAVADGGPTEQRCLFESSAAGPELRQEPGYVPLLPHLRLIVRDAAHRYRSIDKLVISKLPTLFQETLEKLVHGERSLARLLEKSAKFSQLFLECQKDMADREDGASFCRFLKGFSFADHRFDSRKRPPVRLFTMLPILMECLQRVTEGGTSFTDADVVWCRNLLQDWGGDKGYIRLVGSALIADALVMSWPFLKLADKSEADYSLTGVQAAECLSLLRSMLLEGAIWLPAAKGTLVHSVLGAVKFYYVWEAFFKSHFPGFEEANSFTCFNLTANLSLGEREAFVRAGCEFFQLDGQKAWRSFVGPRGNENGLLHRAQYWASPAGIAAAAAAETQAKCHLPESMHQRAWLRTWQDLHAAERVSDASGQGGKSQHLDAKRFIEIYLSSLAGTGVVERWIGEKRSLLAGRSTLHVRSIAASLKLVVQDLKGRRRDRLSPNALLCKPAAARASGGGAPVLFPPTPFLLRAQRTYATWFGEKASKARDVRPASFSEQVLARAKAAKPRLESTRQRSQNSETAWLESHAGACKAAVAALSTVDSHAEGVLGNRVVNPMQSGGWQQKTAHERTTLDEQMGIDWSTADKAIEQQQAVAQKRRQTQAMSARTGPTPFVDSKGGLMRAKPVTLPAAKTCPPLPRKFKLLSESDQVLLAVQARRDKPWPVDTSFERVPRLGVRADMVLVGSVLGDYDSAAALQARLDGARLADKTGRVLRFRPGMELCHSVIYMSQSFRDAYPKHVRVLHACAARAPSIGKDKNPRLDVRLGLPGADERLKFPANTFHLGLSTEVSEECQRLDMKGNEVEVQTIDLAGLFRMYASCYES
ncbi:unnamed protein product [Symbiodinium sp. CCMP2592]|nr:unnamed protein product [Symbiodinium sp. CCMP2592]